MKKIVITGMGAVTPVGIGIDEYWKNITEGKSGIDTIKTFDPSELAVQIAGEVKNFNYVYEAAECVTTGLKDLYHSKKDYSIHGLPIKLQVLGVKLLPHSFVMNTWLNQQKKAKNNKGLTTK